MPPGRAARGGRAWRARRVRVGAEGLHGALTVPPEARGLVVCVHVGDGDDAPTHGRPGAAGERLCAGHEATRHRDLVRVLAQHHLATLFVDLLSGDEAGEAGAARGCGPRCDLALLVARTVQCLDWAVTRVELAGLRVGLCAAGEGAAAALRAATQRPAHVAAVVARSGRPDLAGDDLGRVAVPTLLIVGGNDTEALRFNRQAMLALVCEKRLEVVAGATRRFEEPGALETMAHLAGAWLAGRLASGLARH